MDSISFIVPCYNSGNTILRCLESIRAAAKNDYEVIVVDDCSRDNTREIVEEYCRQNSNVKLIINTTNLGAGGSRNVGVSQSTKNYITFVDSDDTVEQEFSNALSSTLNNNYDAVFFNATYVIGNRREAYNTLFARNIKQGDIPPKDALVFAKGGVLGKIYRRSIIVDNNIKFATIPRNEDLVFTKTALAFCNRVFYLNKPLYNYIDNEHSLMHNNSLLTTNNAFTAYKIIKERLSNLELIEELDSIYLIEIIYATTLTSIRLGNSTKGIKSHFRKVTSGYTFHNRYFWRYSWKYILVVYLMRLNMFSFLRKIV